MNKILLLGIGNLLMGDEGVGCHVVQYLQKNDPPPDIDLVDGGTGGFHLLEFFSKYPRVILIDATMDGEIPGTVKFLKPRFSSDYPRTLTAHDIGLKDLLDALYLLNSRPEIWLYTVSIAGMDKVSLDLSAPVRAAIPAVARRIMEDLADERRGKKKEIRKKGKDERGKTKGERRKGKDKR